MNDKDDWKSMLLKKAKGYDIDEVVEEYNDVEGELVLMKKKVTHKHIPPDTALIKLLLDSSDIEEDDLSKYTDEELKEMLNNLVKDNE